MLAAEQAAQACHLPDSRVMGSHPVTLGTPNCVPMVAVNANWYDPKLPSSAWQMLTIERHWLGRQWSVEPAGRSATLATT